MAIYRTPSRRPLILVGLGGLVVGVILGVLVGQSMAPSLASQVTAARAEARAILPSLDVVRIEYDSLLSGGDSGSPGAIARAQQTLAARKATLALIDPDATARLEAALARVAAAVQAKVPLAELEAAVSDAETIARELVGD